MENDDPVAEQIVAVFAEAQRLAEKHGSPGNPTLEMSAMDLLMDSALELGPTGVVDVLSSLLAINPNEPITRSQLSVMLDRYFESRPKMQ